MSLTGEPKFFCSHFCEDSPLCTILEGLRPLEDWGICSAQECGRESQRCGGRRRNATKAATSPIQSLTSIP